MKATCGDLVKLDVQRPEEVKSLEIRDANIPGDFQFLLGFNLALTRFGSLTSISIQGDHASLCFRSVMNAINARKIPLDKLELDGVNWFCFYDIPSSWEAIFANLKDLCIDINDERQHSTPGRISGLKKILGWAVSVQHLHCSISWDVYLDDVIVATSWPSLRTLRLGRCSITKDFLLRLVKCHHQIQQLDMNAFIFEARKDEDPILYEDARKVFSLPLFTGIKGVISQDNEYNNNNDGHGNWGMRFLEL